MLSSLCSLQRQVSGKHKHPWYIYLPLCRQSFMVKCSLIADTSPWMCKGLVSPHEIALPDIDRLANFSISLFACISCLFLFFWQIHSDRPNEVYSLQHKVLIVSTTWNWLYLLNLGDCMLVRWLWACMHFVQNLRQAVLFLCWSASFHSHQFDSNNVTNWQIPVVKRICWPALIFWFPTINLPIINLFFKV